VRLTYIPIENTDADYAARAAIARAEAAGSAAGVPMGEEDMRWVDSHRKPGAFCSREFVCAGGNRIGTVSCIEETDDGMPGNHALGLTLLPEYCEVGVEEPIFEHLLEIVKSVGGQVATACAGDDRAVLSAVLLRMGFECVKREGRPELDLAEFDASRFAPTLREVERQGIALRSLVELSEEGVDWALNCYELSRELVLEVPALGHLRTCGLDKFREQIDTPWWFPEGWIVALDGERWVGQSNLIPYPERRDVAVTVLTGVVESHRRRGIATSLKVTALERARQAGVRFVHTDNEEGSAMLGLNLRLGFRERYTLTYRKTL